MSNENLKKYNSLISFVNRTVEKLLAREGELSSSYFKVGLESRLDALTNNIKTITLLKSYQYTPILNLVSKE
jgi:hypothetical protein